MIYKHALVSGGVIFVLPAWLAVLLVAKALTQLQVLVKPVSTHLPESVGHPPATSARSAPTLHQSNLYHRACRHGC